MKKWIAAIVLTGLVVLDQFTKYMASVQLQGKEAVSLIRNILELRYLEGGNTGAAFGIFEGKTQLLGIVSLFVFFGLVLLFFHICEKQQYGAISWCLVGMAAGALGNGIDRLVHHFVIDFIYFKPIDFPIFNVADIYVTVSAVLLFLIIAFEKEGKKDEQNG